MDDILHRVPYSTKPYTNVNLVTKLMMPVHPTIIRETNIARHHRSRSPLHVDRLWSFVFSLSHTLSDQLIFCLISLILICVKFWFWFSATLNLASTVAMRRHSLSLCDLITNLRYFHFFRRCSRSFWAHVVYLLAAFLHGSLLSHHTTVNIHMLREAYQIFMLTFVLSPTWPIRILICTTFCFSSYSSRISLFCLVVSSGTSCPQPWKDRLSFFTSTFDFVKPPRHLSLICGHFVFDWRPFIFDGRHFIFDWRHLIFHDRLQFLTRCLYMPGQSLQRSFKINLSPDRDFFLLVLSRSIAHCLRSHNSSGDRGTFFHMILSSHCSFDNPAHSILNPYVTFTALDHRVRYIVTVATIGLYLLYHGFAIRFHLFAILVMPVNNIFLNSFLIRSDVSRHGDDDGDVIDEDNNEKMEWIMFLYANNYLLYVLVAELE